MIYLDNSNSTVICQSAVDKMVEFSNKHHTLSQEFNYELEKAYQLIYDFIGADYDDTFVFSSSGAQAVTYVLFGIYYEIIKKTGKTHIITLKTEDAPILMNLQKLQDLGCVVHMIDVNQDGLIEIDQLKELINPKVALVSMSWASGLTGIMQPVDDISRICEENNILLHLDASCILGKVCLPLNDILIHYLTFAGNLIHAPKSSAGIIMKKGFELPSLIHGETSLDISSLMALSAACKQAVLSIDTMVLEVANYRFEFEKMLKNELEGVTVLYENSLRLPNVSCIIFEKVHSEALLYYLNQQDVFATLGGGRSQHLSNIVKEEDSFSAISFSLSRYTSKEQIEKAAKIIIETVKFLQKMSCEL